MLGISAMLSMCSAEGMEAKLQRHQRERQRARGQSLPALGVSREDSGEDDAGKEPAAENLVCEAVSSPKGYLGHKEEHRGHTSGPFLVDTHGVCQPGGFHHGPLFRWLTSTFSHFPPEYKAQISSL